MLSTDQKSSLVGCWVSYQDRPYLETLPDHCLWIAVDLQDENISSFIPSAWLDESLFLHSISNGHGSGNPPLKRAIELQNQWANQYFTHLSQHNQLRELNSILIGAVPPLRALSNLVHSDKETTLCTHLLNLFDQYRPVESEMSVHTLNPQIGVHPCSLLELCTEALNVLCCPTSWLKLGLKDFSVHLDVNMVKSALTLMISQFSDLGTSPTLNLGIQGEMVYIAIEVSADRKTEPQTHPRFQQDLTYARICAEAHGGDLQFQSTHNQGLRLVWKFKGPWQEHVIESQERSTQKGLVWLIDDEPGVRLTVKRWLINFGYSVQVFSEGPVLLTHLQSGESLPDLIVCDADMPAMPGIEVLKHVQESHPHIKRLLYTAQAPSRWVIEAFNQGVIHRFIDKSEGPNALRSCLEELLAVEVQKIAQLEALDELLSQSLVELFLQPIYHAQTREVEACEALMRSQHPAFRGPLDILNATTLAQRELDLQKTLTHLSVQIRKVLPESMKLFMNIDPIIFSKPESLDDVFQEIYPYADHVVLELTERGQLCGDQWVQSINRLRSKGFEIALDDLGAGYNSLGAVAAVSPEIIKLDISLVSNIHTSSPKREMVRLLSEYAHKHGIKTVAEGIEVPEEAQVCSDLGIRWLQGYHLKRPIPFSTFQNDIL
jgi:EAL domain-containing protein (putative c-di-GMP-specific phosphodiesterase class I)